MKSFFEQVVFVINSGKPYSLEVTWLELGIILLVVASLILINLITIRIIRKGKVFRSFDLKQKRLTFVLARSVYALIAITVALQILDIDFKSFLLYKILDFEKFDLAPYHFLIAFVAVILTRVILFGLNRIITSSAFKETDTSRSKSVYKFLSYLIWIAVILGLLRSTGIKLTVLWGAGAALLVGIGFGLQQIFADLISGLFLLFEANLKEEDIVELKNGIVGRVDHIGIRTSTVVTRDDVSMIIPNSQFIVNEVINWSHNELKTRFSVNVGVAYGSDVRLVEKILLGCADHHPDICDEPKPFVRFENFGNSSLDFQLFFWSIKNFRIENLKSELRFRIDEKFRQNKISIPFPQRDVHLIPPA